jgi:small subunit ribosomal protein S6e
MGQEINGKEMGPGYEGYIFKITGGNDEDGFTMKQGILFNGRRRILFKRRGTLYKPRRTGERKRKSVRGCICGPDLAVIALSVIKRGEQDIAGLTDKSQDNRLAKKRRNNIRAYFNLEKTDDVRRYVNHRTITKGDKTYYKAPKVQRLVTDKRVRRKKVIKKSKTERAKASAEAAAKYEKILSSFVKERKASRAAAKATEDAAKADQKAADGKAAKK